MYEYLTTTRLIHDATLGEIAVVTAIAINSYLSNMETASEKALRMTRSMASFSSGMPTI